MFAGDDHPVSNAFSSRVGCGGSFCISQFLIVISWLTDSREFLALGFHQQGEEDVGNSESKNRRRGTGQIESP